MVFSETDRAVLIDIPGNFRSDIGIGDGSGTFGDQSGLIQGGDPAFPIVATHNRCGIRDLFVGGGLDRHVTHDALVGIDGAAGV